MRYRVQYTHTTEYGNEYVTNEYFDQLTDALDFAAEVGRALVIDTQDNSEVYYHAERKNRTQLT